MLNWAFDTLRVAASSDAHLDDDVSFDDEEWPRESLYVNSIDRMDECYGHFLGAVASSSGVGYPELNAALESFLMHVRVLSDFLTRLRCKGVHPDDVLAEDFFDEPEIWAALRPNKGEYIEENWQRINKSLAHMSYQRIHYEADKDWYIGIVMCEMEHMWNVFWSALPADRRSWFESYLTEEPD